MDADLLNLILSVYSLAEGSINCMLVGHQIEIRAPYEGVERARLAYRREVAIAFVLHDGRWWWGDNLK